MTKIFLSEHARLLDTSEYVKNIDFEVSSKIEQFSIPVYFKS